VKGIYLDHAATTPVDEAVREAMTECQTAVFGNPSSQHAFGREAVALLDDARDSIAKSLGAQQADICFTASGTEAANLAVLGVAFANPGCRILYSAVEHHCVIRATEFAQELGCEIVEIPVDSNGVVDPDAVRELLSEPAALVCVMHANNEIGTVQPIADIHQICREKETPLLMDAVQSFGFLPLSANSADLISLSAHKIYGPKGVGCLAIRPGLRLHPITVGGGQERERRAGTENLIGIAGFAKAVQRLDTTNRRLRDRFEQEVKDRIPDVRITAESVERHPGISHLILAGAKAETVLIALDREGIAASSGAACSSGAVEKSHVLTAIGKSDADAVCGLRFSFGRANSTDDPVRAAETLARIVAGIRTASPVN
jgi:cysteine desulfurase